MYRKTGLVVLLLILTLQIVSCGANNNSGTATLAFYREYNEKTGELTEPVDSFNSSITGYAVLDYGESFNNNSIAMSVYQDTERGRMSAYDIDMDIDPESTVAVFPVEIYEAAEYEMIIYFEDPDEPIANKRFYVMD